MTQFDDCTLPPLRTHSYVYKYGTRNKSIRQQIIVVIKSYVNCIMENYNNKNYFDA